MANKDWELISYNQSVEFNKNVNGIEEERFLTREEGDSIDRFLSVLASYYMVLAAGKTVGEISVFAKVPKKTAEAILGFVDILNEIVVDVQ